MASDDCDAEEYIEDTQQTETSHYNRHDNDNNDDDNDDNDNPNNEEEKLPQRPALKKRKRNHLSKVVEKDKHVKLFRKEYFHKVKFLPNEKAKSRLMTKLGQALGVETRLFKEFAAMYSKYVAAAFTS